MTEAILFIGIQASGKTTFYRDRFLKTHLRISLDLLKTRHREKGLFEYCLSHEVPFVIDNTNVTTLDRARYLETLNKKKIQTIGYYFQSQIEDCLRRNATRSVEESVRELGVRGTYAKLEMPSLDEGFDQLFYVSIKDDSFVVEEWNDEI